ncbi:MAG: flagellar motor protein MotB [Acidobacteriota bacterium]|nr:flagellar motor protein MotB [Acidobacteriota bacterium]
MKPAYYQAQHGGRDRWMVSYLDVLTILLILFVAMAAQTLQNSQKKPVPVVQAAPLAKAPAVEKPTAAMNAIKADLEKSQLDVQVDSRGVVISLPQALLFQSGEDRINAGALPAVKAIGDVLHKIPNNVSLVGHADATPIHNRHFANNWELAAARGLRLLEILSSRYGIEESRLSVASFGSYDPKSSDDTPDGRASNRRVEIVILNSVERNQP